MRWGECHLKFTLISHVGDTGQLLQFLDLINAQSHEGDQLFLFFRSDQNSFTTLFIVVEDSRYIIIELCP